MPSYNWLDMTISHESRTQAQCHCAIVYVLTSESDNWLDMTISRESRTHVQCQCQCAIVYVLSSYIDRDPPRESVKGAVRCDRRTRVGVQFTIPSLFAHFLDPLVLRFIELKCSVTF